VKKTKHDLKSSDIIDSLNPNISAGFSSILGGVDSTLALKSIDFLIEYVKGVDYTLAYAGGVFTLTFLTMKIEDVLIAQWFDSTTEMLRLTDLLGDGVPTITESSQHGVDTSFLRTTVEGLRLRPSDISVQSRKQYDMFPSIGEDIEVDSTQQKSLQVVSSGDWNDRLNSFDDQTEAVSDESKRFVFEFGDPFVVGTTSYVVRYGKGKTSDPVASGTFSAGTDDAPRFYRTDVSATNFQDLNYHVLLKNSDYREWRLATGQDFGDMNSDNTTGALPVNPGDVKTLTHFYIKRMNRKFGLVTAPYVVYEHENVLFFINNDGHVIEDELFANEDIRNPLVTNYPDKTIRVFVSPTDLLGNPLFRFHSESGNPGFDAGVDSAVKQHMSAAINRVDIRTLGLNVNYDNYGDLKQFLLVDVAGHPINKLTELKADKKLPGSDHADARQQNITNDFMQHQAIVETKLFLLTFLLEPDTSYYYPS